MKHIRNFRNFSINEMQDWAMMPVDVNRGMGDMINQFYSEFPKLASEIKNYLGNKFSEFKTILTNIALESKKLDPQDVSIMEDDLERFIGRGGLRENLLDVVKKEFNKAGIKENRNSFEKALKNVFLSIFPNLRTAAAFSFITSFILIPLLTFVSVMSLSVIVSVISGIIVGICLACGILLTLIHIEEE